MKYISERIEKMFADLMSLFASRYFLLIAHTSGLSEHFKRDFSRKEG